MSTEIIANISSGNIGYSVKVDGLKELMNHLKKVDPALKNIVQNRLKEAAQPALNRARANARAIADDGTYEASLSLKARSNGNVVLASNDIAAGVKEFARRGARYKPKSNDKRRNARKMYSFPVGVPLRANPPRVMVRAVNDSVYEIQERLETMLGEVLNRG